MTEDELMEEIRTLCSRLRLKVFHCHDSRRSWGPGFPDLVIAGPRGVLFREAKDNQNNLSPEQRAWGSVLQQGGADWSTWRPRDWTNGTITRQLLAISRGAT